MEIKLQLICGLSFPIIGEFLALAPPIVTDVTGSNFGMSNFVATGAIFLAMAPVLDLGASKCTLVEQSLLLYSPHLVNIQLKLKLKKKTHHRVVFSDLGNSIYI